MLPHAKSSGEAVIVFSVHFHFLNLIEPSHSLIWPSNSLAVYNSHGLMLLICWNCRFDSCLVFYTCFHCYSVMLEPCGGLVHHPTNITSCLYKELWNLYKRGGSGLNCTAVSKMHLYNWGVVLPFHIIVVGILTVNSVVIFSMCSVWDYWSENKYIWSFTACVGVSSTLNLRHLFSNVCCVGRKLILVGRLSMSGSIDKL